METGNERRDSGLRDSQQRAEIGVRGFRELRAANLEIPKPGETNPIEATRIKTRIISNLRRNQYERSHYDEVLYN